MCVCTVCADGGRRLPDVDMKQGQRFQALVALSGQVNGQSFLTKAVLTKAYFSITRRISKPSEVSNRAVPLDLPSASFPFCLSIPLTIC